MLVKKMDIRTINVISLAYLGDSVYEVYVREHLIKMGISLVENLQREAIKYVSAKSQSKIVKWLTDNNYLNNDELDIIKRGRNYKRGSHPKNTDIITYKNSTGFETLIGYLYLDNKIDRLDEIIRYILEEYDEKNC